MGRAGLEVCVLAWFVVEFVTVGATPIVEDNGKGFRYEEYLIEHEISSAQAKKALTAMNFTTGMSQKKPDKITSSEQKTRASGLSHIN